MVRVVPIESPQVLRTLGFLAGQGLVQADVKSAFAEDIGSMFEPGC